MTTDPTVRARQTTQSSALRKPVARITIQRRQEFVGAAGENASVITSPEFYLEGEIMYAMSKEAVAHGTFECDIYNLPDSEAERWESNGIVTVEAGYEEGEGADLQNIFYGVLNYALPLSRGAERVWQLHATVATPRFDIHVPYTASNTYRGDIIQYLAKKVGLEIKLPSIFFESIALRDTYTSTESVSEEIAYLVQEMTDLTGTIYMTRVDVHRNQQQPFLWEVIPMTSPEDNPSLLLEVDEAQHPIYNAGPVPMQGEADNDLTLVDGIDSLLQVQDAEDNIISFEHQMSLGLDARLSCGMWVHAINSNKPGTNGTLFFIRALSHRIGADPMTDIKGPIIESSEIIGRRVV